MKTQFDNEELEASENDMLGMVRTVLFLLSVLTVSVFFLIAWL